MEIKEMFVNNFKELLKSLDPPMGQISQGDAILDPLPALTAEHINYLSLPFLDSKI